MFVICSYSLVAGEDELLAGSLSLLDEHLVQVPPGPRSLLVMSDGHILQGSQAHRLQAERVRL